MENDPALAAELESRIKAKATAPDMERADNLEDEDEDGQLPLDDDEALDIRVLDLGDDEE